MSERLGPCPRCGAIMRAADENLHRTMYPVVVVRHTMPCPPMQKVNE